MVDPTARATTIALPGGGSVSGLIDSPADPQAAFVLAHGAGAGMAHGFLAALADGLASRGVATLRFNFPYLELGGQRPDPPVIAQAAVRAAVAHAAGLWPGLPLFAGGKSFGGRMTTQAQAAAPLEGVRGIVLVGFPLHPAGKPAIERAAHLAGVEVPMLFLQGTRDALAELPLVRDVLAPLAARAKLHVVEGADHSFHVPARSGRTDAQVLAELVETSVAWMRDVP
jgi:predicted alpha/beta-hydrolase family hydrolase